MMWGEEAVRRREEMTEPPPWPVEVSERSEFRREGYRDISPTTTGQVEVSPRQHPDDFLRSMGEHSVEGEEIGIEDGMGAMSITPTPVPPQQPPPTQPSPRPPFTLPPSLGETRPTLAVNSSPELEHLVLARPSPHRTPVRSTPREPSEGGPSSEGAGGSAEASSETAEKGKGKRRKPSKGKRAGKQRKIGRNSTKEERMDTG